MKLFKEFIEDLELDERELSDKELKDREHNVKRLKKHLSKFKSRYGKDGESIMYAIATRDAKRDKKYEETELGEGDPFGGPTKGKRKVATVRHKTSGKELSVTANSVKKYEKMGYEVVDVNKEYVNYPYGPLDTMRPMADLGDIPNYYGTKLHAQRKKKKLNLPPV